MDVVRTLAIRPIAMFESLAYRALSRAAHLIAGLYLHLSSTEATNWICRLPAGSEQDISEIAACMNAHAPRKRENE
jgi:hypothetical protein